MLLMNWTISSRKTGFCLIGSVIAMKMELNVSLSVFTLAVAPCQINGEPTHGRWIRADALH